MSIRMKSLTRVHLQRTISRINHVSFRFKSSFSHIDSESNTPRMVDVTKKFATARSAHAQSLVIIPDSVFALLDTKVGGVETNDEIRGPKGPVFATAIIAGVMGAKQTSNLIPFCHPLPLEHCEVKIEFDKALKNTIRIDCIVKTTHKTGVEMEALVGASLAALCVYDMLKAVSHDIIIKETKLVQKTGGKSDFGIPQES